jgi:hypothetical protein
MAGLFSHDMVMEGRSLAVSVLTFTHRAADEKKFPALCRSAPLGRHLCRTNAKEFPSSVPPFISARRAGAASSAQNICRNISPRRANLFGCRFYKAVAPTALRVCLPL